VVVIFVIIAEFDVIVTAVVEIYLIFLQNIVWQTLHLKKLVPFEMLPVLLELPVIELEEGLQRKLITSNLCLASIYCEL